MAWSDVTLADGSVVGLYVQSFAQECGPSSVATVGRLHGRTLDISQARTTVGSVDHNKPPGGGGSHDWGKDWSYMTSLTQALSQYGVRMAYTRKSLADAAYKTLCEGRTKKKPGILRVEWADGSGHFVVTVGKNGAAGQTFIEILDPYYGYQRVPLATFPTYTAPKAGTAEIGNGTLDRFWSIET